MHRTAKVIVGLLLTAPVVGGCTMFGGGETGGPPKPRYAGEQRNPDCARLAPLVSNPDGSLSRTEMEAGLKAEFAKWDKDGNGALSAAEVQPLNDSLRALNVGASPVMDWNGDGHVNFQEFAGGWRTMFDLCSRDKSDVVTKADMARSPNVAPPRPSPIAAPQQPQQKPQGPTR